MYSEPFLKHELIRMVSKELTKHSVKHKTRYRVSSKYHKAPKKEVIDIAILDHLNKPKLFVVCRKRKGYPFNGFITSELLKGKMNDQKALYKLSLHKVPLYLLSDSKNIHSAIEEIFIHIGLKSPKTRNKGVRATTSEYVQNVLMDIYLNP